MSIAISCKIFQISTHILKRFSRLLFGEKVMLFRSLPPHIWYSSNWNDSAYISDGVSSQDIFPHRDEILKPSVSWERLSDPFFLVNKLEMMILAIQSFRTIKIICDNSKWQQILLGSRRVSKEVPGQFPVAKRGGRQRDRRKAAGRRELQARDGSPPKGPTWAIVHCLPISFLPVKYPLQGWCDLVRDCSEQLP